MGDLICLKKEHVTKQLVFLESDMPGLFGVFPIQVLNENGTVTFEPSFVPSRNFKKTTKSALFLKRLISIMLSQNSRASQK